MEFLPELPQKSKPGRHQEDRYDELTSNPGLWVEWWGRPAGVHQAALRLGRPGFKFEAAIRAGKPYIRAVRDERA